MRIRREIMNTVKSCGTSNCKKNEKEGMDAAQISKWKKLNGRRYKELLKMKSKVKANGSDPSIQKENLLSKTDVNVTGPKDSNDNETTNTNSSLPLSKPERVDFLLRRVTNSGHAKRSNSPDLAVQTEVQKIENSILESGGNVDESKLQEKIEHPSGEENKSTTTEFVEYWVPVRLSNIQTEQYCGSLFSNSTVLCSSYGFDPKKFLHEILVSTKKCCDHPYLVDWSLHTSLIQGIPQPEQLDAQIKLSSKLFLLHKALLEINKRGLRVLVLYQSLGGSGPITAGDILDDIIHEKFGGDSFVRIDGKISRFKRQAVLDTFNEKEGGKFVCLMETRACVPSIKLKSIDTVIFFNSDWDPMNDLKALQKINLDSQFEQVKVFRMYSAYTVEEKVLMLTKQGMTPDGNVRNIKRSTCHELLTWGAYFLFQKLEDFHAVSTVDADTLDSHGKALMEDVFNELSILLPNNDKSSIHSKSSLILEVQQIGGVYPTDISLVGEVEYPLMDNFSLIEEMLIKEPPSVFWINILEGRTPSWKYFSCQSPGTRKSVQSLDELLEECIGPSKDCRTEAGSTACQIPTTTRRKRRRRQSSGEAAALKPSSMELHSLSPPDDHDQLPSLEHSAGESPPQTTRTASDKTKDARARETSQVTHVEVCQSVYKALQTELERLEQQKTESSKQHEDMKLQTRMACEKEVDQIHKKYEEMLQNADTAFLEEKQALDTRYNKVLVNKALADALMERDSLSQVAIKFSVEQAYRLISQTPRSSTVIIRGEPVAEGSVASPAARHRIEAGCLRAPAPHLRGGRNSPPCTVPKPSSERPRMIFSPVSLQQVTSSPLAAPLPP